MKKTLLLSVVASTMIMAGGDIAPVEPVVVVEEVSAWEFEGEMVAFTQTRDNFTVTGNVPNTIFGNSSSLFGGNETSGILGLSLGAANKDLFAGIGFGSLLTATANGINSGYSNSNFGLQTGSTVNKLYLTYGIDSINTSLKVGRQYLPKSLSPFAFTEGWQAIKNSFEAALVVNSSLPDTTAVYAYVTKSNNSLGDIDNWDDINPSNDGIHLLTLQNKSIDNLTLTGSWYYAPNFVSALTIPAPVLGLPYTLNGDANILWGDAAYAAESFGVAIQGGQISPDDLDNTTAFGAKVTTNLGMFDLLAAYSTVNDGALDLVNLGTGVKTPLYTQMIGNQNAIRRDSDTIRLGAGMKALGGKFGLNYSYSDLGDTANNSTFTPGGSRPKFILSGGIPLEARSGSYTEVDLTYKTKVTEDITLFAAYIYQEDKRDNVVDVRLAQPILLPTKSETQNLVRFWARYNFN
ncbi:MAG: hypothetical protein COB07_03415 [Sulfurovum sp.]|nr:MAG: hypothetical protein COB07_03415 [Sulfurovum sp.]